MAKNFENKEMAREAGKKSSKKGQKQKKTILKEQLGIATFEGLVENSYKILAEAQKNNAILQNGLPIKVDVAKTMVKIARPKEITLTGDLNLNINVKKFID